MKRWLKITLLSDTCFSMPASPDAMVDTNIAVDVRGLPLIPGKTLHGLLRDTWLSSREFLDEDSDGLALLGEEKAHDARGKLRIGDARMSDKVRHWISYRQWEAEQEQRPLPEPTLREAFSETRTLTAMCRETGAPKTETLRVIRVLPAGVTLYAPLETTGDINWELFKDLVALTRHAGLYRNRGLGHVAMQVETREDSPSNGIQDDDEAPLLCYRLTLTAPCLISLRQVEPNSCRSLPYIPGAAIRGAVAAELTRQGSSPDDLQRILASEEVRFLNAYPERDGRRALPGRITWRRIKDAGLDDHELVPSYQTWDLLDEIVSETPYPGLDQREALKAPFYAEITGKQQAVEVDMQSRTHQSRDRETGITRENDTQVYVYEAIAPEQSFIGFVALPPEDHALRGRLEKIFRAPLWLGRSARSQYGGSPQVDFLGGQKSETDSSLSDLTAGDEFDVRLTSDAVLRDPNTGQHDPWRLQEELRDRFEGYAEILKTTLKATRAVGYNRLWRTRLPEIPAAAAGSVARLRVIQTIDIAKLQELIGKPLGERIEEGKGCFIVEHAPGSPLIGKATSMEPPAPLQNDTDSDPQDTTPEEVLEAQKRLYAKVVRALVAYDAISEANNANGTLPAVSQIQRMRTPLRDESWQETYQQLLEGPKGKRLPEEALQKLKAIRLGNETLFDRLLAVAKGSWVPSPDAEERDLHRLASPQKAAEIWDVAARAASRQYVDGLLNGLARRKKHASETGKGGAQQ